MFVRLSFSWLNESVKNPILSVKNKFFPKHHLEDSEPKHHLEDSEYGKIKSTDVNILLNRVRLDEKKESRKKLLFSVITFFGILLFGSIVF
jgi:hypothetical protein